MSSLLCLEDAASSNSIADRGEVIRIGSVLRVSLFAQNLPTCAPTSRRVVSVAPKTRSQLLVLVIAFRGWVSRMETTAL